MQNNGTPGERNYGGGDTHPSSLDNVDTLLTAREGAALLDVSLTTWWRRVGDGLVPLPLKIGHLSRWPKSEIVAVIERAKACRDARSAARS